MQPGAGVCGASGGKCISSPDTLQYDDIASLNRLYPITAANLAVFPGKVLTASHTVSIQGTISFRAGLGMQGVNVLAVPIDASGNPMPQYTVSFVSGAYFSGDHGNAVTGWNDANGAPLSQWGSENPAMQGFFDLSFMPLPPGLTSASYQITFEAIDPLFVLQMAVGPYSYGSPAPSGTLNPITVASPLRRSLADSRRQRSGLRRRRLPGRHFLRVRSAHAAGERPVGRPHQPGGADRLVQLSRSRQPRLHRGHHRRG